MAATVRKLENEREARPESPWPDVQPPAVLAPKTTARPPKNACQLGSAAVDNKSRLIRLAAVSVLRPDLERPSAPAKIPAEKTIALGGQRGFSIPDMPNALRTYRAACS
jgi:hypothetical protein